MAITDSLTGCYNRSFLTQELELQAKEYINNRIPFSIILLDIDFFKSINDSYGHLVGDRVLRDTVEVIQHSLRIHDILARYGGEEFIICLPNTQLNQANIIAERVKSTIESNRIIIQEDTPPISITVSIGLLSTDHMEIDISKDVQAILNELFESVDRALYQAKSDGRNRIVSSSGIHLR
ncbi:Response regulator PleD [compost metagenome]